MQQSHWEYKFQGTTVHRPNHGLAHTLRTACYASIAVKIYNLFNSANISSTQEENIQLATLFYIVGRENEDTFPSSDFTRFHVKSAEAFEKYVRAKLPKRFTDQELQFYKGAIVNPYSKSEHQYHIVIICHNLDLLRCKERQQYISKYLRELSGFKISQEYIEKLANGAEACLLSTGDRIYGERDYNGPLFVECSRNVQTCLTKIYEVLKSKLGEFMVNAVPTNLPIPEGLRSLCPQTPWHFSPELENRVKTAPAGDYYKKCDVLPSDKDFEFVRQYILHQKPPGWGITKIVCVRNPAQLRSFENGLEPQEQEANNPTLAFAVKNGMEIEPKADRAKVLRRWEQIVSQFSPIEIRISERQEKYEKTKALPVFHGTTELESVCRSGFTYFGKSTGKGNSTDMGYFGSGYYFTTSANYAWKYSRLKANKDGKQPVLLLGWVSMRKPFPVVNDVPHPQEGSDMKMLKGKEFKGGKVSNYNANYIPVANSDPANPDGLEYYPCYQDQKPAWDEIVVSDKNQTLFRFWIEFGPELTNTPGSPPIISTPPSAKSGNLNLPSGVSKEAFKAEVKNLFNKPKSSSTSQPKDPTPAPEAAPAQPVTPPTLASQSAAVQPATPTLSAEEAFQKGMSLWQPSSSQELIKESVSYFQIAANQGNASAQHMLGYCYGRGFGVQENYKECFKWTQKAADQGHIGAQAVLGHHYYAGIGVEKDYNQARIWLQKAMSKGDLVAKKWLEELNKTIASS